MRILLASTYELGHQPLHLAVPAGALRAAGHDVTTADLAVEPLADDTVDAVDAVAVSVPMHTATRLAETVVRRVHLRRPELPIALFGLYAGIGAEALGAGVVDRAIVGEYLDALVDWVDGLGRGERGGGDVRTDLSVRSAVVPDRSSLPPLDRYAHLEVAGEHRLVGYVEASHGCRHRCRHCPIPAVYDGRFRIVDPAVVAEDAARLVSAGAQHLTFGDPDFLNGPAHALKVLRMVHAAHPDTTFDVTVKVEHLLRHADLLPELAECGVVFVVSAFETVDDDTLRLLDKGHTSADMVEAVARCRDVGIDVRPSWMPFTPWTSARHVVEIFRFLDRHDLLGVTDPVQMGIRLLVPEGSLLLDLPEMQPYLDGYDTDVLTHRWSYADPSVAPLQRRIAAIAERAADGGSDATETLVEMWRVALEHVGDDPAEAQIPAGATAGRPRLTEPWFC